MRLAHQFRPLVVGLPMVMSIASLAAQPAAAWDFFGSADVENPAVPPRNVRTAGAMAAAPSTPHWRDGQAVQYAYAEDVPPTGGVEQTAHTGPSRSGTLFGGNRSSSSSSAKPRAQAGGKKPPTWRGYSLRMPTKLFGRGGDAARSQVPSPSTSSPRTALATSGRQQLPAQAPAAYRAATTPAQRMNATPGRRPVATMTNATSTAQGRQTSPQPPWPMQATQSPSKISPQHASAPSSLSGPSLAGRSEPRSVSAEPAATTIEPKTPADRLILQAHDLAANAEREEDFTRLIETCRRGRASQPSRQLADYANQLAAWAFNRRGQIRAEAGRLNEAMLDFDDAIRANPELWRALHNRGVLQAQAGNFELAFDDFNLTIRYNPEFAKVYSNRAALFVVAGDLPAALEDYRLAIELDPNLAVAHRGRGRVCHLLGRLDEAINHYDAAVQLAPQDAYAISSRADLLTDVGRYSEAAAGYDQAIRTDRQFANAYRGSAWLLATCPDSSVRDANLAVERAELAIELDGREDAVSYDTLAAALASAGDFSRAMQTVRQAIQFAPDNERQAYQDRLKLYQRAKPYRIAPMRDVAQVNYESTEQGARSRE